MNVIVDKSLEVQEPAYLDLVANCANAGKVGRYREVRVVSAQQTSQPATLFVDWAVPYTT
jgi:hypothetical protein